MESRARRARDCRVVTTSEPGPDRPKSVDKPEAGTRLSAAEIHDNILGPAKEEMERSASALLWSAFASGLTIGFSFLIGAYAQTLVPQRYAHAISGAVYPLGFMFVIFARSELFTENTLEPVIPLLHNRDVETLMKMLRLWGLLLVGNLVGAALFAWVMYHSPVIGDADVRRELSGIAQASTSDGFSLTLVRGVMAGWLIALLAWLLASTQESVAHLMLIWLTTAPIAWLGFRHSIVGSVEAFYRVAAGTASLGEMGGGFIVPAVIGNTIGGVVLVALLNYGQIHHERGGGAKS
ncbi:MAG: Formate/nitrite transporter FocA, family [Gemmatimonadetes bacterium]|nr:Formate/nitrite transporter FocA, family [Gemmatimonadota bacterium]